MRRSVGKLVLFGAGKIGRSFIGQLFSRSGYEVVFVDISKPLVEELNRKRQYRVIIKSDARNEILLIQNVRGIFLGDTDEVIREFADADIAALSVGQPGLPDAIPVMAQALVARRQNLGDLPLDIIIAENLRNADRYLHEALRRCLPHDYPLDRLVGLVETSIGKMVPIMTQKDLEEDPLQVFAEPYNSLIVAKNGFKNPVPDILDLEPKENMKAWVDRKLFIHNLGHATATYLGYRSHPSAIYIHEVLANPEIWEATRKTMLQSADILMALYPGEFTISRLTDHIDDLLNRFRNKALGDTLFRVGCDLYRKLSPEDRLVAPINAAIRLNKPYDLILQALLAAISFRAVNEQGEYFPADIPFFAESEHGKSHILRNICRLELSIRE